MKALKALVVVMGILLVAGMGMLIWGVATRIGNKPAEPPRPAEAAPPSQPAAAPVAAPQSFGSVAVPLPEGAQVEQVGWTDGRVVLWVTGIEPERIVILDPVQGVVAGEFVLTPAGK